MWIEIKKRLKVQKKVQVTPYAGVWIEICSYFLVASLPFVTPYAGVWIEIIRIRSIINLYTSLPTRECGLKSGILYRGQSEGSHSLRGSVDWNICSGRLAVSTWSLPTRECGLKFKIEWVIFPLLSHSLRGSVDWNFHRLQPCLSDCVTPYAGVWIEIEDTIKNANNYQVTPYAGVWIEISIFPAWWTISFVTPYAGVWIEISIAIWRYVPVHGHSLRGSVDWNLPHVTFNTSLPCHSLRGSVDWNYIKSRT